MSSISNRIFALFQERGMEQKEFAVLLGGSDKTVSAWRNDKAHSYTKHLAGIAKVLRVLVEYLVNGNHTRKSSCRSAEEDKRIKGWAAQIVPAILDSVFTYQKANDALEEV